MHYPDQALEADRAYLTQQVTQPNPVAYQHNQYAATGYADKAGQHLLYAPPPTYPATYSTSGNVLNTAGQQVVYTNAPATTTTYVYEQPTGAYSYEQPTTTYSYEQPTTTYSYEQPTTTYSYEQPTAAYSYEQPGSYAGNEAAERYYSGKYPTGGATGYTYSANEPYMARR